MPNIQFRSYYTECLVDGFKEWISLGHVQSEWAPKGFMCQRPTKGSITQLAACCNGKREALGLSSGRATICSSPVTFGVQCGFRG